MTDNGMLLIHALLNLDPFRTWFGKATALNKHVWISISAFSAEGNLVVPRLGRFFVRSAYYLGVLCFFASVNFTFFAPFALKAS